MAERWTPSDVEGLSAEDLVKFIHMQSLGGSGRADARQPGSDGTALSQSSPEVYSNPSAHVDRHEAQDSDYQN